MAFWFFFLIMPYYIIYMAYKIFVPPWWWSLSSTGGCGEGFFHPSDAQLARYLYFITQIGISVSPLSNNALFLKVGVRGGVFLDDMCGQSLLEMLRQFGPVKVVNFWLRLVASLKCCTSGSSWKPAKLGFWSLSLPWADDQEPLLRLFSTWPQRRGPRVRSGVFGNLPVDWVAQVTLSTDDPLMFHTTKDVMGGLKSEGVRVTNRDELWWSVKVCRDLSYHFFWFLSYLSCNWRHFQHILIRNGCCVVRSHCWKSTQLPEPSLVSLWRTGSVSTGQF